ncbi:MAG TPA: hypothetical protein VE028_13755 [Nitratidesulfovibrio sp.]|nr:hypothetical protein [Nitratidesulfovibrio sp.]
MSDAVEVYRFDARDIENLHQALRCGRSGVRVEVEHIGDCNEPHAATLWLAVLHYLGGRGAHVRLLYPGSGTGDPHSLLFSQCDPAGIDPRVGEEHLELLWLKLTYGIEVVWADAPPPTDGAPEWPQ